LLSCDLVSGATRNRRSFHGIVINISEYSRICRYFLVKKFSETPRPSPPEERITMSQSSPFSFVKWHILPPGQTEDLTTDPLMRLTIRSNNRVTCSVIKKGVLCQVGRVYLLRNSGAGFQPRIQVKGSPSVPQCTRVATIPTAGVVHRGGWAAELRLAAPPQQQITGMTTSAGRTPSLWAH